MHLAQFWNTIQASKFNNKIFLVHKYAFLFRVCVVLVNMK